MYDVFFFKLNLIFPARLDKLGRQEVNRLDIDDRFKNTNRRHFFLWDAIGEKNGIMWEKFPSGGPPPPTPPVWEFSHFFTVFVKLVMPFYKLLNWKKQ